MKMNEKKSRNLMVIGRGSMIGSIRMKMVAARGVLKILSFDIL
jgi:hypothetical protein